MLPFPLPSPHGIGDAPEWTGGGFRVAGALVAILEYSEDFTGWSDDLTTLHEEAAGDSHPIDLASRDDALNSLESNLQNRSTPTILEIGCSSGFMLRALLKRFPTATIVGADVVRDPLLRLAKELPSIPLLRFDLVQCPLPSDSFDAVVMLNVLEHIENDILALRQVHRVLKPGGVAVVEVPAGPHLYDSYDAALRHFRRYKLSDLAGKMREAGFTIRRRSHLGFFLYPAFALVKRRNQRTTCERSDQTALVRVQASQTANSPLMRAALAVERRVGKWVSFPIGIRCLLTCRK